MHFDEVLESIGDVGPYQIGVYFIIAAMEFLAADSIHMNFMGYNVEHWCHVDRLQNLTHAQQRNVAIPDDASCE